MEKKYLKVIEALGEIIINKDLDNGLLKYENEKLKAQLKSIEDHCEYYVNNASNTKI